MPTFQAHFISEDNLVFPVVMVVTEQDVQIIKGKIFGISKTIITRQNIAGVKLVENILFSSVMIETAGGMKVSASGFRKRDAREIVHLLT